MVSKYEAKQYHSRHRDQGFQCCREKRGLKHKAFSCETEIKFYSVIHLFIYYLYLFVFLSYSFFLHDMFIFVSIIECFTLLILIMRDIVSFITLEGKRVKRA